MLEGSPCLEFQIRGIVWKVASEKNQVACVLYTYNTFNASYNIIGLLYCISEFPKYVYYASGAD